MAKVALLVGTTLGGSEYVADEMAAQLDELNHQTKVFIEPNIDELADFSVWILVCSTHGAGDLPDNIVPFHKQLMIEMPDLNHIKFALCAIGDSSYDTFCQGPEKITALLLQNGSKAIVDKIQIDVQRDPIPEEPALAWLLQWQHLI
ncbi:MULTISPECIES: FMN-binding protein MioC [unclassified Shewanella]|jgi:MioC protein|uniref:FMN-binding protein MioC n=1 Tax=unclassified Shewanella TaxID=196818 RepID=UPI00137B9D22|nr:MULTISPECIES: FMN-binding protein MioC [unclassified Shewanella]MBO1898445.1 FMN-binding protein MioC [Shewanella sp. BF02_Schw]QHS15401.1 FMN-binding protein MioC [Shewanella sp. Arc9-LZ]